MAMHFEGFSFSSGGFRLNHHRGNFEDLHLLKNSVFCIYPVGFKGINHYCKNTYFFRGLKQLEEDVLLKWGCQGFQVFNNKTCNVHLKFVRGTLPWSTKGAISKIY